ncbi:hypothetical protein AUN14_05580 [Cronobacter muytjensii]|uniref:Uncharacterized protein n=1 Tax=Cronobacter muytjensii TaxID=413501 RepID=A0A2T7AWE4_9ENTR|nr:hypothetical protein AUN14_05580 [Cronobacter muytjensii]
MRGDDRHKKNLRYRELTKYIDTAKRLSKRHLNATSSGKFQGGEAHRRKNTPPMRRRAESTTMSRDTGRAIAGSALREP